MGFFKRLIDTVVPPEFSVEVDPPVEMTVEQLEVDKILGISEDEVLFGWLKLKLPDGYFVLLRDIDLSFKGVSYWRQLSREAVTEMAKDYVVLRCRNRSEMTGIVDSIEPGFCDAYGIKDGEVVY